MQVYPEETPGSDSGPLLRLLTDFPHKRQVATVLVDVILIVLAFYAAHLLRYEEAFQPIEPQFITALPIVIGCQILTFALFRTYQGAWRHTSLNDMARLGAAAIVGTTAAVIVLLATIGIHGQSRSVFILDGVLLVVFVGGSRVLFRALAEWLRPRSEHRRRVLIYGAGDGGVLALRELQNNAMLARSPVGFIDDDRTKHNSFVHGVPVLCGSARLAAMMKKHNIEEIVLAASLTSRNHEHLERVCQEAEIPIVRAMMRLE
jgi:UDP-GlcNAc:undecaprenyl-phosphate GlcNAc-1-phosphate transferase